MIDDVAAKMEVTSTLSHPAVQAWSALNPGRIEPSRVSTLCEVRKTQVYRLESVGPQGANVIAKRCRRRSMLAERMMYETILPLLPINCLRFFGFSEETEGKFCWLFLEDAIGEDYSPENEAHRELAAKWIASLHTSASRLPVAASLPNKGAAHYLKSLRNSIDNLNKGLSNPVLTPEHMVLIRTIMSQLSQLETRWQAVAEVCDRIPQTLIHGDLAVRNVRVRNLNGESSLVVMDWNHAGWGVPATDLLQGEDGSTSLRAALDVYVSEIRASWPQLDANDVRELAFLGRIFHLVRAIEWVAESLPFWWVDGELKDLARYEQRLRSVIASPELK